MNPVRDDPATIACALCRRSFVPQGRQRYCSTTCRQSAWRRLHQAPVMPLVVVAKASTVYECDTCGNRYLGTQRCEDCNTFARKVGPGGCCPYCDEPVALADIIDLDQMRPYAVELARPNHVSNVSVQPGQPQSSGQPIASQRHRRRRCRHGRRSAPRRRGSSFADRLGVDRLCRPPVLASQPVVGEVQVDPR